MNTLQFLGTGWSHGVPSVGCTCPVCIEQQPRNIRTRPSIRLTATDQTTVVIDTGPDFRHQAVACGLTRLDAVFITHRHADHVMGLDDIRRFTWVRDEPLQVFGNADTVERLRILYPYITPQKQPGRAVPLVEFSLWDAPVQVGPFLLTPFEVPHADIPCYGVRISTGGLDVGYVPDCSGLPASARAELEGVDLMILNAMRVRPHPNHLSLEQSIEVLKELDAPQAYLTHMGCPLDYYTVNPTLPDSIQMAYDGLTVDLSGTGSDDA